MKLRLVGLSDEENGISGDHLEPEERLELETVIADPDIMGLTLMTRDGVELRSDGMWSGSAAAIFSNVMRLVDRIGENIGEAERRSVMFTEVATYEVAVVPLTRCDVMIVRKSSSGGGLSSVG